MAVRTEYLQFGGVVSTEVKLMEWFKQHPWLRPGDVLAIPCVDSSPFTESAETAGVFLSFCELEDPFRGDDPRTKPNGG